MPRPTIPVEIENTAAHPVPVHLPPSVIVTVKLDEGQFGRLLDQLEAIALEITHGSLPIVDAINQFAPPPEPQISGGRVTLDPQAVASPRRLTGAQARAEGVQITGARFTVST